MRKAKGIDGLYSEVRDYDIVLTNDAPLATALNARVDTPRIGGFAYTPRAIAGMEAVPLMGTGLWGDLRIVSGIAAETGQDFKFVHGELENIRRIRRYTMDVERFLYSAASRDIYRSFRAMPTPERLMGSYVADDSPFFKGRTVAVIGIEFFDDLDKHFIPSWHDEIDIFDDSEYSMDMVYEVGNDRQLADNAVDLIDTDNATDTAIVMDVSGPVADAVRAALYRKGIPFKNTMAVRDLSQIRDYLQFLSLSLSYGTVRVRHVRELFSAYGGYLSTRDDGHLLHGMTGSLSDRNRELAETMRDIRSLTFGQVSEAVADRRSRPQIRILTDDMGLTDSKVDGKSVDDLIYAVNNVSDLHHNEEIPEEEKRGVLLADCKRSVYVDRPAVIFLGLGPEWSPGMTGKEYIDREEEADLNMHRFTVLLQQGSSRVYAVNSMRGGRESRPCPIFDQMRDGSDGRREASGFGDVCGNVVRGTWYEADSRDPELRVITAADPSPSYDWRFSKSTYNAYSTCPRSYLFAEILASSDTDSTVFGSIVHEFAEFYLCYPDMVRRNGPGHYMEMIQERYAGLSCSQMREIDGSRIRVAMMNVMRFIDLLGIEDVPLDRECSGRKHPNMFMEHEGCTMCSSMTEAQYRSRKDPLFGNFDLVYGNRIVDYKTGKPSDLNEIMNKMLVGTKQDYVEFQPMIYLALLRDSGMKPPLRFSLFYISDNEVESASSEDFNINRNIRDVVLRAEASADIIAGSDAVRSRFRTPTYKRFADSWDLFADSAIRAGLDRCVAWAGDGDLVSEIIGRMGMSDCPTNIKKTISALKKLAGIVSPGIYDAGGELWIPSDTMDAFLRRVREDHDEASVRMGTDLPGTPLGECSRCRFFQVCTRDVIDIDGDDADE